MGAPAGLAGAADVEPGVAGVVAMWSPFVGFVPPGASMFGTPEGYGHPRDRQPSPQVPQGGT